MRAKRIGTRIVYRVAKKREALQTRNALLPVIWEEGAFAGAG
jgi:hypothetical protein